MGLADQVTEYFDTDKVLPASGQGILAIETLADNAQVAGILSHVNDVPTYCIAVAEMAFLKALNAGCQFPVASFAEFVQGSATENAGAAPVMKIRGIYWDEASKRLLRAEYCNPVGTIEAAREAGFALAGKIRELL